MNRKELELRLMSACADVCIDEGFINEKTVEGKAGGTSRKITEKYIDSISLSQTRTMGISDNQFKISIGASCSILEIESLWNDYKSLVNPKLADHKYQAFFEKRIPQTYFVGYDKNRIREIYPDNISDNAWLNFEISEFGIEQFKKVIKFIIQKELLPELEKYRSLKTLDRQLNSSIELGELGHYNENGILFRRIIVAKLVSNPLFEKICQRERTFFTDYIDASKEPGYEYFKNIPYVFEEVYKRLQNLDIV